MAEVATPPAPGQSRAELYTYQSWVHVGPDAENCEDVNEGEGTCECRNPLHFHAWVRLPNPQQRRGLQDKANASKARRMRLARELDSDLNVILEESVERLAARGEHARQDMIDELVNNEWWRYYLDAQRDLAFEREDPDDDESPLRWEHLDDDRAELRRLRALHADEQPADEIRLLEQRAAAYDTEFEARKLELQKPLRDELAELDISALVDRVRNNRIDLEGSAAFQDTLAEWQWVTCTYRSVEGDRYWQDPDELAAVPESVIEALTQTFNDLMREKGGLAAGNS